MHTPAGEVQEEMEEDVQRSFPAGGLGGGGLGGGLGGGGLGGSGLGQFPQHIPARYMSPDVVSDEELPQLGFEPATCVCVLQIRSPQFLLKVSHSFSESPTAIQLS